MGFSIAGNVRVGNALGANDTAQAKLSAKLAMLCAGQYVFKYCFTLFTDVCNVNDLL